MTDASPVRFAERLRRLRSKRYEDWWHIVFGGPVGTFVCALIAEVRWITPNLLTGIAFAARLGGAALLTVRTPAADLAAVVLLQLGIVLDIMDGSLARYRRRPSALGAFLDKVTDVLCLAALGFGLGVRAYLDGGGPLALAAGAFIGTSYLARCYMYWLVAYLERDQDATATVGPRVIQPFGELGLGERLRYYLRSSWRIVLVGEGDVYFWVSLFLLLGRPRDLVLPLAAAMAVLLIAVSVRRALTVMRLDR